MGQQVTVFHEFSLHLNELNTKLKDIGKTADFKLDNIKDF
jgi:hypothetical protein